MQNEHNTVERTPLYSHVTRRGGKVPRFAVRWRRHPSSDSYSPPFFVGGGIFVCREFEALQVRKMKLEIAPDALDWFRNELSLKYGDTVRLLIHYQEQESRCFAGTGFSMRFSLEKPRKIGLISEVEGITFFIDDDDLLFYPDFDRLMIRYDSGEDRIVYQMD
jgi:uncharacterized protein YneR